MPATANSLFVRSYGGGNRFARAIDDVRRGLAQWPLWGMLGWLDIRQKYRRAIIGPFWITLSMGVMVSALGITYSALFRVPAAQLIPYITAGFIIWFFISAAVTEGALTFVSSDAFIKHGNIPLSLYVFRMLWRNTIIMLHNAAILILVYLWTWNWPGLAFLQIIPAFLVVAAILFFGTIIVGGFGTRFRDLPPIITNVMQVAFFVTPVLFRPEMLEPHMRFIVYLNPFFHLLEALRAPMLGQAIPLSTIGALVLLLAGTATVALLFYARVRGRIAYWL